MMDSSDDFFSQQTSSASSSSLRTRRAPPPPPPRNNGASRGPPPPPPKASLSLGTAAGGASTSASSYYGNNNITNTAARPPAPSFYGSSNNTASQNATATAQSSYYGTSTPAPAPAVPVASAPAAPDASDWYQPSVAPAPAPMQQFHPQEHHQQQQPNVMNPYDASAVAGQPSLEGAMDSGAPAMPAPQRNAPRRTSSFGLSSIFGASSERSNSDIPPAAPTSSGSAYLSQPYDPMEFADDPPLLEELGIDTENIWFKTKAVLFPLIKFKTTSSKYASVQQVVQDVDLAGPLAFALALGGELLLSGKVHFSYIYGFGLFGCLSMTLVLNLMSPVDAISVWTVTSILGYALLPVNILALVKLLLLGYLESLGRVFAVLTIAWCTVASTRLLEQGCGMRDQRYLVAYPIALLYSAFVMITIF